MPSVTRRALLIAVGAALLVAGCATTPRVADPLPSWVDGAAKARLLDFVATVTDPASPSFVPVPDRLAVFDHDGTLIVEKPRAVQFAYVLQRVRELAPKHPEWATQAPFAAVIAGDEQAMEKLRRGDARQLVDAAQGGLYQDDFAASVREFLASARDARFATRYAELTYAPMRELVSLLQARQFTVFVVSGGGIDFIRELSELAYGIPAAQVIGSTTKYDLRERDGRLVVYRKGGFSGINVGRFKPLNIHLHAGRRPILAVGNSDGDLDMLRYATDGRLPSMAVLLEHDDAEREYAYDDAPRARERAAQDGWLRVSMRDDWRVVFAPD